MTTEAHRFPIRFVRARSWIPWAFVGAFLVVIAANAIMTTLAIYTFTGVETRDSYKRGLGYNQVLSQREAQSALGWRTDLRFEPEDGALAAGRLVLALTDADGAALTGASVGARFIRPTQAGSDFKAVLDDLGGGRYGARVVAPMPGVWDIRLSVQHGGHDFYTAERVVTK